MRNAFLPRSGRGPYVDALWGSPDFLDFLIDCLVTLQYKVVVFLYFNSKQSEELCHRLAYQQLTRSACRSVPKQLGCTRARDVQRRLNAVNVAQGMSAAVCLPDDNDLCVETAR